MEEKFCEIRLPGGRLLRFSSTSMRCALLVSCVLLFLMMGLCVHLYLQLADYRANAVEFAEYKQHKQEQREKLQRLVNDNEIMLRKISEIIALQKRLHRDFLIEEENDISEAMDAAKAVYTGYGSGKQADDGTTMALLSVQYANIANALDEAEDAVSDLLLEAEARKDGLAYFPNLWPTDGGFISSDYGGRSNPVEGVFEHHGGIDIAVEFGTPVYAAAAGAVEQSGMNGGYGRYIRIDHGNGYETAYGHMSALAVEEGQRVYKGQVIGYIGSSGYSTYPHVHYEVFSDGMNIDPAYVLNKR